MIIKEPELKLFGRNILLPEDKARTAAGEYSSDSSVESSNGAAADCGDCWYLSGGENGVKSDGEEKQGNAYEVLNHHHQPANEAGEEEEEICEASFPDLNQNPEESHDTPKAPPLPGHVAGKKPDKILPCPRCKSPDTKFCYFNNYNVNQPRHFCRACQRYWTHGGATRNVPVGSGRRKNKTHHHHVPHPPAPAGVLSFDQEIEPPGEPISTCYYYTVPVWHAGFPRPGSGKRSRVGCGGFSREGVLKGLQWRGGEKRSKVIVDSSLLQVNPAALARSMSFREGYEGNCISPWITMEEFRDE